MSITFQKGQKWLFEGLYFGKLSTGEVPVKHFGIDDEHHAPAFVNREDQAHISADTICSSGTRESRAPGCGISYYVVYPKVILLSAIGYIARMEKVNI